jgi:hypothetical protein
VHGASRDQQLLTDRGAVTLPSNLELDVAIDDENELVTIVREVLPPLPRRVDP